MKNKVQLITYTNRFGGGDISELHSFLDKKLDNVFQGGVHLLPFFYPIDGSDAGYDPIDHREIDNRVGSKETVKKLSQEYDLTADLIVNHISDQSKEFKDVEKKGSESEYFDLFLTKEKIFSNKATQEDIEKIYRPRPNRPFSVRTLENGEIHEFWTTFGRSQLDIDVSTEKGKGYISSIIDTFSSLGIKTIRLDAVGYVIKKAGSSCFMLPETYEYISDIISQAHERQIEILVEIHAHFETQIKIASIADYVYDFALPPLVLHTIFSRNSSRLKAWLKISPRNCVTVLDTHDGIGVMDVASQDGKPGLLLDEEIDQLVESIHLKSDGSSRKATGIAASNLDLYQVNCTFYDALGRNQLDYLTARAIQLFCPGIPQIYYAGFLAAENDMALLEETKVGRDINRPFITFDEIEKMLKTNVVQQLKKIIEFRNSHASFQGAFSLQDSGDHMINIKWETQEEWSELHINLQEKTLRIKYGNMVEESTLMEHGE